MLNWAQHAKKPLTPMSDSPQHMLISSCIASMSTTV